MVHREDMERDFASCPEKTIMRTRRESDMSERYQQEIEDILRQVSESPSLVKPMEISGHPLLTRLSRMGRSMGNLIYLNPGRIIFIGMALLLSAIFISAIVPGLVGPIVWSGLILFILAYALFFARTKPNVEKRWRGRLIENQPYSWSEGGRLGKFHRWLKR
jgi:hypothetical protein